MSQMMDIVFKKHRENVSFQFPLKFFKTNKHFFLEKRIVKTNEVSTSFKLFKTIVPYNYSFQNDRFDK